MKVMRLVPWRLARRLGRSRVARRWLLPVVQQRIRRGHVLRGPGAGLLLAVEGGNPGVLLGASEPPVQEFVGALGPEDVFYDVGANIGFFSLIAARNGATVFAFDPHPSAVAALRENLAANGLDARVVETALSDTTGEGFLDTGSLHAASLSDSGTPVEIARLDDLDLPPPTAVKIDVDGAEIAALRGMQRTLAAHHPRIVVEAHGTQDDCVAFLRDLGYRTTIVDDGGMPHVFGA